MGRGECVFLLAGEAQRAMFAALSLRHVTGCVRVQQLPLSGNDWPADDSFTKSPR